MPFMPKRWWYAAGFVVVAGIASAGFFVAARNYARNLEPRVRERAIRYLENRFDSQVELRTLRIRLTGLAPLKVLFHRGRGVGAVIEGEGVVLRHHGRRDVAPLFSVQKFRCRFDAGTWLVSGAIEQLQLEGMEINVPPADARAPLQQN